MSPARGFGFALLAALGFGAIALSPAAAQTPSPFASWQNDEGVVMRPLSGPIPDWEFTFGGGVAAIPEYTGSKHYEVDPVPVIDIRYKDIAFLSTGEGIGVNLLRGEQYRAGLALGYDIGRSQTADRALNGTGSIEPAPVIRAFAEGYILPFIFQSDIRQALGGVGGLAGDLGVYMPVVASDTLTIFAGPSVTIANGRYMQRSFGIGTAQAAPASRYAPYRAGAGLANANFGVSVLYSLTDNWLINGDLGYQRLVGSAAGSPLVQTKNQLGGSLTVAYDF